MKKSIILVITLMFVAAVSALIYQNVDDTDSYIKQQNYNFNKAQLVVSVKNVQEEISRIFLQNADAIEGIVENASVYIPFKIEQIDILFKLRKYDKLDINLLSKKNEDFKVIEDLFLDNDVNDFTTLHYLYNLEKKVVTTMEQRDDIINKFIKETLDNKIEKIRHKLGFITKDAQKDIELYELFVRVNYLDQFARAYYILNKKGEVRYFELSFK